MKHGTIFTRTVVTARTTTTCVIACAAILVLGLHASANAEEAGRVRLPAAEREALDRGLAWLAANQGETGNWDTKELGLVSLGALAFLADGHKPGEGKYGKAAQRSLEHVLKNAQKSGLLHRKSRPYRDIYNHSLSTMVLGQAVALGWDDGRKPLARAVALSLECRCEDGGWDYLAKSKPRGHDLSLLSLQIGALSSARQAGVKLPDDFDKTALACLHQYYSCGRRGPIKEEELKKLPGQFTYSMGRILLNNATPAMAAAGALSLHKLGAGDDWRAGRSLEPVVKYVGKLRGSPARGIDGFALLYLSQATYLGGEATRKKHFGKLREYLLASQRSNPDRAEEHGSWHSSKHITRKPGQLLATSVACLTLAMPLEKLPMLKQK